MKKRILDFQEMSLGLFVHYGLFSVMGQGEWVMKALNIPDEEYEKLTDSFNPKKEWADEICKLAMENGFQYVVLTTRHHDGFSLYDTKKLNCFDSLRIKGNRDLVLEFVNACRKYNLKPFFYHTLIDWREEKKHPAFSSYLSYLRESIKILCTNYGEIGGLWFDGQWKYPNADWEEDELYSLIREYQPDIITTNNAGLNKLGKRISTYIDVATFERNNVSKFDYFEASGDYAAEMCQTLNSHWGYASEDLNYKSIREIILSITTCRKYNSNFLLNIGPMPDGSIREIEKQLIQQIGRWINKNKEALYKPKPIKIDEGDVDFVLSNKNIYYYFFQNIPMEIDPNVSIFIKNNSKLYLKDEKIESAIWLDDGKNIDIKTDVHGSYITGESFKYGKDFVTRVAKIVYDN